MHTPLKFQENNLNNLQHMMKYETRELKFEKERNQAND